MQKLRYSVAISLDGFVAGPNQSRKHPVGEGGELLHGWLRELKVWRKSLGLPGGVSNASTAVIEARDRNVGAYLMGRNMFGGGPGPWTSPPWNGWRGKNPPFKHPVYVLSHYQRAPLVLNGGTTFHFVTDGARPALELARKAAKGKDVVISGGAETAKAFLAAGLIDEVVLHLVPVVLGAGIRLFDGPGLSEIRFEQVKAVEAPGVTHLEYRLEPKPQ